MFVNSPGRKHELTANVNLQFTEVSIASNGKLNDDESVGRKAAGTLQFDCGTISNSARVLTTDGVVPQCRCGDDR